MQTKKLLLTPVEAGELLGYRPQTARNKICQGTFPVHIVRIGNKKMIRVQDLMRYVDDLPSAEVTRKRGAPTKKERLAKKLGQFKGGSK